MGRCKSNFLAFLFLIFVAPISFAFSNNFSLVCGTWVKFNRITKDLDFCLSIEKLSEEEYFIVYTTKGINYTGDIYGVATIYDENKLIYKKNSYDKYFIYYEKDEDVIFVLWNHEIPDDVYYDVKLERVLKILGPDALTEEDNEKIEKEQLMNSVRNYFKSIN